MSSAERNGFDERVFPGVFSIADLLSRELPPARWVVPDLLPEGVTLLAGKPKIGKTWLAQGLAVAIATGGVALGSKRVEQGEVLYLALEDQERRLHKRFKRLLTEDPPRGLSAAVRWPTFDVGGAERIGDWCATHPNTRLVVIDTLKKVRPRTNGQRSVYD